ncbi:hypothetical protein [Paenibacillus pinihumi]|uniref:hypothetical protein n=1 Tax=Paenibacillus pinihumi TaxID=669462 RepID=UPI00048CB6B1|nr:hypothetical protein [Paenibacillus pinihumi]
MFRKITVVTAYSDNDGDSVRLEYPGVLIAPERALYVDAKYSLALLEKVVEADGHFYTTGGPGTQLMEVKISDPTFIHRYDELSATEFLSLLIPY